MNTRVSRERENHELVEFDREVGDSIWAAAVLSDVLEDWYNESLERYKIGNGVGGWLQVRSSDELKRVNLSVIHWVRCASRVWKV